MEEEGGGLAQAAKGLQTFLCNHAAFVRAAAVGEQTGVHKRACGAAAAGEDPTLSGPAWLPYLVWSAAGERVYFACMLGRGR